MLTSSTQKELRKLREQLLRKLAAVDELLNEQPDEESPAQHSPRRSNMSKGIADMAYLILEVHGRSMHRESLLEKIEENGIDIRPEEAVTKRQAALSAILSRDTRFKSLGKGTGLWEIDRDHVTREEQMNGQHNVQIHEPSLGRISE